MRALSIPFRVSNGSLAITENYDDIVRWQVLDAAATNEGERVMRPTWGLNVRAYLYRPSEHLEQTDAASVVYQRLSQFVPRATVVGVQVEPDPVSPNLVTIDIGYKTSRFSGARSNTLSLNVDLSQGN